MQVTQFLIDDRFILKPDTHTITDLQTNAETRLEPRLVKLLLMLAGSAGLVVTRDEIIREVWNDYGGAEDGLNQAISFLRKTLDDEKKEKIRTVPKKGYILAATVTTAEEPSRTHSVKAFPRPARKLGWLILTIITVPLLIIYSYNASRKEDEPQEAPSDEIKDTTYQYQEMKQLSDSLQNPVR